MKMEKNKENKKQEREEKQKSKANCTLGKLRNSLSKTPLFLSRGRHFLSEVLHSQIACIVERGDHAQVGGGHCYVIIANFDQT